LGGFPPTLLLHAGEGTTPFVFADLNQYREELRSYRRDSKDQIVAGNDQLQNATRWLVISGISQMCTQPQKKEIPRWERYLDITPRTTSWLSR
jgi:hypothetical protein